MLNVHVPRNKKDTKLNFESTYSPELDYTSPKRVALVVNLDIAIDRSRA